MRAVYSFLGLAYGILYINETFNLVKGLSDNKFELTKPKNSGPMLFLMSIGKYPTFEFSVSLDYWNSLADYYDTRGWVLNSNTMLISIPGNKSGIAYAAIHSDDEDNYVQIKRTTKSPSLCLFVCKNGGICENGKCLCGENYGGTDCGISVPTISANSRIEFKISSMNWEFYRVRSEKELYVKANVLTEYRYRLFISSEKTGEEIPTMLDAESIWFSKDDTKLSFYVKDAGTIFIRIGVYCYAAGQCEGNIKIEESESKHMVWVIIFSVLVGVFVVVSVPLGFVYCHRARATKKVQMENLSKGQMENMFPKLLYTKDKSELCSICLDYLYDRHCRELCCMHVFHEECIDEWASANATCPVCKQGLKSEYDGANKHKETEKLITEQNNPAN
jgi:uncharacterized protein YbaR (Trm112 family)